MAKTNKGTTNVPNKKIAEGLESAAQIKAERDFLIKNLNKDCIGKTFRGVERCRNGELKICWDVDEDKSKSAIAGSFHSSRNAGGIVVENGADAAYLLMQFLQLATQDEFVEFISTLNRTRSRMEEIGNSLYNGDQFACACCENDPEPEDNCPQEVLDNCPRNCDNCPEQLRQICDASIERDEEVIALRKQRDQLLEEQNDLLKQRVIQLEAAIKSAD